MTRTRFRAEHAQALVVLGFTLLLLMLGAAFVARIVDAWATINNAVAGL